MPKLNITVKHDIDIVYTCQDIVTKEAGLYKRTVDDNSFYVYKKNKSSQAIMIVVYYGSMINIYGVSDIYGVDDEVLAYWGNLEFKKTSDVLSIELGN